ncbi:lipase family protein, partial [Campylobacter sp. MIT 21-1682]|uniref:lipase family protein n=1 Tax=Campylobacter sp. MIT 21-1682 TaxID=2993734 RepID=UPI002B05C146|nr:hypothetical protein [Campylobacter sp. MIT 21-1682]
MNPKDFIEELKDYADIADASYALLHSINENEDIDTFLDTMKANNANPKVKPPARWIYADGIRLGYEISEENTQDNKIQELIKKNKRELGQATAYALAIEARFSQDKEIFKPKRGELVKIDNTIQSFVDRDKEDINLKNQKILVATTKEQQSKDSTLTYHLSPRTKAFTSRFEILHHQANTSLSGYSHTLFKDTQANDTYILAFRGTEVHSKELFKDAVITDGFIALGAAIPQIISLVKFKNEVLQTIEENTQHSSFKINVVGHSLGGHLAF